MAGLRVNPFALFAAQATQGIQGAGAAQPVARVEQGDRFAAYKQADIKGNPFAPSHAGGSTLRGFGGVNEGCGQGLCLNA